MPFNWLKKEYKVPCYSQIAPFYDYLMRHVNYARWYEYLTALFNMHLLHHESILEIACGTGILLEKFSLDGWKVYGFDYSRQMAQRARRRLQKVENDPAIWVGDMRQFALSHPVDAVICLYDSINYCLDEDELLRALACIYNALSPGGLLIFDAVTVRNCKKNFQNFYEKDEFGDIEYIRQSHFEAKTRSQINEFFITVHENGSRRFYEQHVQHIFPIATFENLLKKFQWEIIGIFDNFSRRPGSEKSDRVHFVVRKK